MATKVFWLHPGDGGCWHSPGDVVSLLASVFDHVSPNREEAHTVGQRFLSSYRALLELGNTNATPLEVVERQWKDAIVLRVWDDSGATAAVEVVVKTEDTLQLQFPPRASFQKKRRSAEKMAHALGYVIEHFDPSC